MLAVCAGWAFAGAALAEPRTLSWDPPTTNEDGTPLTNIAGYRLYAGASAAALAEQIIVGPAVSQYVFRDLAAGTWFFGIKTLTPTSKSEMTAVVSGVFVDAPPPPPPPPPSFATVSTVAYFPTIANSRFAFLIIGTVPLGTLCDKTQVINGFNVVPRTAVTFDGPAKPTTVVARCQ